jgi:DNA invertase Pin-like site-specific DNA recombinase/RNase P subunit RPR2
MSIKNAIGIERRSDLKQKDNLSFETQEAEILARAEKEGYQIVEIIKDDANSAYHKTVTKREAMNNLLQRVLDDEWNIEAIFFYDESRLTRQFYDFTLDIYRKIKEKKPYVKFFSTSQSGEWNPYDLTTVIRFANAAQESVIKSRRAKDAQNTLLFPNNDSKPKRPGSIPPYGYSKIEKGELVPNEFAPIVILIFHLTSWGHSQETIAKFLNEINVSSPSNKLWVANTVDYILNNQHYLGHIPWNIGSSRNTTRKKTEEYDILFNQHEPIVPVSLWQLAHHAIELHKTFGKNNNTQFILRDILVCKECNILLQARDNTPLNSKKKYLIYRCPCCKKNVPIETVHNIVQAELFSKFSMKLLSMNEQIMEIINNRKKVISKHLKKLKQESDLIDFNQKVIMESDSDQYPLQDLDLIFSIAKEKVKNQIQQTSHFIEDNKLNSIFKGLNKAKTSNFKNVELRTLMLSIFRSVTIDLSECTINIKYRLTPFVQLENFMDQIS